jgi:hypothetical protein
MRNTYCAWECRARSGVVGPHGQSFGGAESLSSYPDDKGPPSPAIGAAGIPAWGDASLGNSKSQPLVASLNCRRCSGTRTSAADRRFSGPLRATDEVKARSIYAFLDSLTPEQRKQAVKRNPLILALVERLGAKPRDRLEKVKWWTLGDLDERITNYDDHDEWYRFVVPHLREIGVRR